MRYTRIDSDEPDYKKLALEYAGIIGCLVSKTGPIEITEEDIELYKRAELRPMIMMKRDSVMEIVLLDADEFDECIETGMNPRA